MRDDDLSKAADGALLWEMVRALAVADLINAETTGKLLDITTEQAERLIAGWRESANKCPECGQRLPGA